MNKRSSRAGLPVHLAPGPLLAALFLIIMMIALRADAGQASIAPSAKDKCPVCGMFVAKYPDWTAAIVFKDGTRAYFDGAKDLFKYLTDLNRYAPGRSSKDIDSIVVKDYYSIEPVDGRAAYFVIGSDVLGPMGRELIPFGKESDAREFRKDHKGKRILRFPEVTADVLRVLDQ